MKKYTFIILCLMALVPKSLRADEYPKVIIPGDYADPTILRDGADFI
jgi:hypothetical protein